MHLASLTAAGNGPSAVWRHGTTPPVLDVSQPGPSGEFLVRVAGRSSEFLVSARHGELAVRTHPDGTREISCPACGTSDGLVHQEWVYSFRDVVRPTLQRVNDDRCGTRWFLTVSLDGNVDGTLDISDGLAAPFLCRSCGGGYSLPDDIHITFPW